MTAREILRELRSAGAVLTVAPNGVRITAPKGGMTPARTMAVRQHRDALLALVIAEHDQGAMDAFDDRLSSDGAEPEPLDAVAHRERWDMAATVDSLLALSDEKRAVYRAALAFDTEALQRADAVIAVRAGQPGTWAGETP